MYAYRFGLEHINLQNVSHFINHAKYKVPLTYGSDSRHNGEERIRIDWVTTVGIKDLIDKLRESSVHADECEHCEQVEQKNFSPWVVLLFGHMRHLDAYCVVGIDECEQQKW